MQAWFESLPTWVVTAFGLAGFITLLGLEARRNVQVGRAKTFWGGLVLELTFMTWSFTAAFLVVLTINSMESANPDLRKIQYICGAIVGAGIGMFCYRRFLWSMRESKRALWAGHVIMVISLYLLYRGWQH